MEGTCSWCNKKAPYLQAVEVKVLSVSNNYPEIKPEIKPICKKCEQQLNDYELSWEVLSH